MKGGKVDQLDYRGTQPSEPGFPGRLFMQVAFMQVAQIVILQPASGVELERKMPADAGGSVRVVGRWLQRVDSTMPASSRAPVGGSFLP